MAMSVAGGGRGAGGRRGRRRGGGGNRPMSDINVTPMVDVMLVLLIVFMVAAPLMTVGVPIDLPETQARQMETQSEPITVSVTPEGQIFLGDEALALDTLVERVAAVAVNGTEDRIYVRGDGAANYGTVMQVMGALSGAGYSKIGLITDQEQR
jgi:biopolymer transport protein TolR